MLVNLLKMAARFFINFTVAKLQKRLFTAPKTEIFGCPLTGHYTWKTNIRIVAETNVADSCDSYQSQGNIFPWQYDKVPVGRK